VVLQEITDNDLHLDFVEPPKGYFESTYVYGLDLISATDEDGVQTYYFSDGLGSTTTVADAGGGVASEYGYDVFGELRGQSGLPDDVMLFTGEQYDARARRFDAGDPGLYYLRARYYDPAIGRFLTQDPLPMGNLYAYVGNNPVNYVDPTGLQAAAAGTIVILSCTGGAAASAGTSCVVGVVAVTGALVVVGVCVAGAPCAALGGAIVDAGGTIVGGVVGAGEALVEGAGDVGQDVVGGIKSLFGKRSEPKDARHEHYAPQPTFPMPTLSNFPWRGCGHFRDPRMRLLCWTFLGGIGAYVLEQFAPVLIGEKPPVGP